MMTIIIIKVIALAADVKKDIDEEDGLLHPHLHHLIDDTVAADHRHPLRHLDVLLVAEVVNAAVATIESPPHPQQILTLQQRHKLRLRLYKIITKYNSNKKI